MSAAPQAMPKKAGTKKRKRPRIYVEVREVIDVKTGRRCRGMLAMEDVQRHAMRERGFKIGQRVALDVHPEREYSQWKQSHRLGTLLVEHVEGFEGLDAHKAIKKVQLAAGIECDTVHIDARPVVTAILRAAESVLGVAAAKMLAAVLPEIATIPVNEPRSLSFDEMGADVYTRVFGALCRYVGETYFPQLDADAINDLIQVMPMEAAA